VYDSELGGEVFIPAKTTTPIGKPTKKKTTPIKVRGGRGAKEGRSEDVDSNVPTTSIN